MDPNVPQPQPGYPPVPQYVYMTPPPQPQALRPKTSGFAVTGLVTGIIGLVFSWVPFLSPVLPVIAVIFGSLGWHYASTRGLAGKGMGIAGLVMGIIAIAVFVVLLIAIGLP